MGQRQGRCPRIGRAVLFFVALPLSLVVSGKLHAELAADQEEALRVEAASLLAQAEVLSEALLQRMKAAGSERSASDWQVDLQQALLRLDVASANVERGLNKPEVPYGEVYSWRGVIQSIETLREGIVRARRTLAGKIPSRHGDSIPRRDVE